MQRGGERERQREREGFKAADCEDMEIRSRGESLR